MVHNHQSNLAKTTGCITKLFATILQLNLSPPVCLRQESEGKACHFLSGDVDEEHLFGFRDQKVAGSNPVTSTKACQEMSFPDRLFSTLCTKTVDYSGLLRFSCVTDCEGFCRILSDSDALFSHGQTTNVIARNQQKSTVANSQRQRFSDMDRKNKTV